MALPPEFRACLAEFPLICPHPPEYKTREQLLHAYVRFYIGLGWRVLPLHALQGDGRCPCRNPGCTSPGKHPRTRHGVHDATLDEATALNWWRRYPGANIGIATGNGLFVIDIDPRHGGSLTALQQLTDDPALTPIVATASVRSGGEGLHLYFTCDPNLGLGNSAGLLAPGIDTRGEGGYVVAPPSRHFSGGVYLWTPDADNGYLRPLELPTGIIAALKQLQSAPRSSLTVPQLPSTPSSPPEALTIPEGQRNTALVRAAGVLARAGFGDLALQGALLALNQAQCSPPLAEAEVRQIIKSARPWEQGSCPPLSTP